MRKPAYKRIYKNAPDGKARAAYADSEWESLCSELEDSGVLTEQRKRIVDRLVRERVEYEFLAPVVAAEGAVKTGPNGGDVFNFNWSALQKHKDQILKLEEALKLTVQKATEKQEAPLKVTAADKFLGRLGPH